MNKTYKKSAILYFIATLLIFSAFSCRKLVTDEFPDYDVQPVIYGLFKDADVVRLHLSFTDKLQNASLNCIEDAFIVLSKNNIVFDTLQYHGEGFYLSRYKVFQGNRYGLNIQIPNYLPISHTIEIPVAKKPNHIKFIESAGIDEDGQAYSGAVVDFKINPFLAEYHQIIVNSLDNGQLNPLRIYNINDPVLQSEGLNEALFSTSNIKDPSYSMQINFQRTINSSVNPGQPTQYNPIIIEFRTVCKAYYQHHKQLILYNYGIEPDPFGHSLIPVQLYSNIQGSFGVISSYSACYSDTIF
ncbi:MAG: DUF4249 family protein [Bacteroidales bacterium]|nr:DUF4249 family protein [Bacteroidales bacterium]